MKDVFIKVDVNMGYVYILTNKSLRYGLFGQKLIKIGKTNREPDERAQELSSTGVPTPFEVAYALPSDQYNELERKMHRRLDTYRSNKNREFFRYPVKKAIKLLKQLSGELSRAEQQSPKFEQAAVQQGPGINRFIGTPHDNSNNDYKVKLGIDGKPYYSPENGFQEAVNANGIIASIRNHVTIIIDNEELEIRASREHFESKIDELHSQIDELEENEKEIKSIVKANQDHIVNNQQLLSELKAIDNLETRVAEKIEDSNQQQVKLAELKVELEKFPAEEGTSKHRKLPLYPIFAVFCAILSLSLYFFYVSALDKAFFSNIDMDSTNMASYARLNEIFDPTAVFKTFEQLNFWLFVAPFFPLALAFAIHPCIGYVTKNFESDKRLRGGFWVVVIIAILAVTFVLDSLLALQISKKIHESAIILGIVETEVWPITPINPLTWDLNIYIVLFFGFVVSLLLGLLFHVTADLWTEARVQRTDDRNSIVKELGRLEAEMKNLDDDITRLSEDLENGKKKMGETPVDAVLIKAQIDTSETDIQNLKASLESDKKRIENIQSEITQAQKLIDELEDRKNKRFVDLVKLRAQIDEFLNGWNKFLAAKGGNAEDAIERTREVAYEVFNKHFSGGIR